MSDVLINPARVRRDEPLSAEEVVSAVERALLTEVRLTPKPRVGGYSVTLARTGIWIWPR